MKKMILATSLSLFGLGCGPSGTDPGVTDCSDLVVLTEAEILANSNELPVDSCWLVDSDFELQGALVVKEGVVIEFAQDVEFKVAKTGSLSVEGTEAKPVLLSGTEKTKGFWQGIEFGSKSSANKLEHVILEFAGSGQFNGAGYSKGAIFVDDTQVSITNSILRENAGAPIIFVGDGPLVTFENNSVLKNDIAGRVFPNVVGKIADSNTWEENTEPSILVGPGVNLVNGSVVSAQTWLNIGTTLKLVNSLTIQSDLKIAEGVEILVAQDNAIFVKNDGSLNAVGSSEKTIIIKGANDTPGYWDGIGFSSKNSSNIFNFVTISNGGGEKWNGSEDSAASIYMEEESKLILTNSTISKSEAFALTARKDGDISGFANNVISDNAQALNIDVSQLGNLDGDSKFENNTENFISIPGGTMDLMGLWKKQEVAYRFLSGVSLTANLQIEPGAVFEFGEAGRIIVEDGGSMNAEGTSADKIIFKGADSVAGFWKGLSFISKSSQNILKNVDVLDAGSEKWSGAQDTEANVYVVGRVDISDSKISNGAGWGIMVSDGEVVSCSNVDLSGNAKGTQMLRGSGVSACP